MTLVELIRKRESVHCAAATATPATGTLEVQPSVASVATVAVARPHSENCERTPTDPEVVIEPASPTARPVYWESEDGTWHGPVKPEYLGRTGSGDKEQFWVIVSYKGTVRWIWSDLLRSRQVFDTQRRRTT
jgi:hypothetical protein